MLNTKEVMSSAVVTIGPEDTVLEASRIMLEKNIRHLPVVDKSGKLIGIMSNRDIQRAMVVNKEEIFLNSLKKVNEFMSSPVVIVSETSQLADVIDIMVEKKISAVVVEETRGIITTQDLLKHLQSILRKEEEMMMRPLSFYFPNTLF